MRRTDWLVYSDGTNELRLGLLLHFLDLCKLFSMLFLPLFFVMVGLVLGIVDVNAYNVVVLFQLR